MASRNHEIYSLFQRGSSITELAGQFHLSPQRIGQIIAAQHPEGEEDYDRSLYRGYLWRLFEEIRDLYRNPGWKMAPTGRPAEGPDGEPAEDVMVRLQAGELELKILESLRKMDARDRPAERKLTIGLDEAERRKNESLAAIAAQQQAIEERHRRELEEVARRAAVIPGTAEAVPVRELPPAGP